MHAANAILVAGADPLSHVVDKNLIGQFLTMNTVTLIVAAIVFVWVIQTVAKAIGTGPESEGNERYVTKGKVAQLIEVITLYLRDTVIRPQLGAESNKFLPLLLSLFFFILINNLFGLIPLLDAQHLIGGLFLGDSHFAVIGGTATGRIAVTAGLATVAFIVWNAWGIKSGGVGGWLKHFTGGAPWYLWIIMIPVEIMGLIVKPAALTIRLFANMTAGHILLAVLIGFVATSLKAMGVLGAPVSLVSFAGAVAIMFLELFVAFLQAFIFMFLTTLFIAQLTHHHDHDHDHGHDHEAGHGAGHGHGHAATA
jgi:F-type H+-transporting ATPase subunit a